MPMHGRVKLCTGIQLELSYVWVFDRFPRIDNNIWHALKVNSVLFETMIYFNN